MLPICLPSRGQHKNPLDSRFGLQWLRLLHLHLRMPCCWWRLWRLLCLGRLLLRLQVRRLADLNKELHRTGEKKVWWSRLRWFVCSQSKVCQVPWSKLWVWYASNLSSQPRATQKSPRLTLRPAMAAAAASALADALLLVALVALVVPGALAAEAAGEEIGRPEQRTAQDRREKGLMK